MVEYIEVIGESTEAYCRAYEILLDTMTEILPIT